LGFEQGVVQTIESFLDEFAQHRHDLREAVQLLDMCISQVDKMVRVGDGMAKQMNELRRVRDQGDEHED